MTHITIPSCCIHRTYEDTTVVMDNRAKRLFFLEGPAGAVFRKVAEGGPPSESDAQALQALVSWNLINANEIRVRRGKRAATEGIPPPSPAGAVNLWAFRNRIPISGHFELTGRCNLRCRHCYCTFTSTRDSLTTDDIFRIIDDLHEAGTMGLVLTGGEIFIRSDIGEILGHLERRNFILRLNTNGTLLSEKLLAQIASLPNIYRIHVSLYGATASVHDSVTRSPGSFDKTIACLAALKSAGQDVRINCSIMKRNAHAYREVRNRVGDKLGIPVRYDPFIFPKDDGSADNLGELITGGMLAEYDAFSERQADSSPKKRKLCKAAFAFFSIDEGGDVYPCLKMKKSMVHPLGNLKRERFGQIWESSAQVHAIRASLESKLRNCSICDLDI